MPTVPVDEVIRSIIEDIEDGPRSDVTTYHRLAPVYDLLFGESYDYDLQADYVRKHEPEFEPFRILEVGCGTGRLLDSLAATYPDAEIRGVDIEEGMVELARDRLADATNVEVVCGDALDLDGTYDVVAAFNVLPHFGEETLGAFFDHAASLLSDTGTLLFDYKLPENNPDGRYDRWEAETDRFVVVARFLTIYDADRTYYAVSYEFEAKATGDSYTTGELMDIHFQRPATLEANLRAAGFESFEITRGIGDQSGIGEATK